MEKLDNTTSNDDFEEKKPKKQKKREKLKFKVESTSSWKHDKIKDLNIEFIDKDIDKEIEENILDHVPQKIGKLLTDKLHNSYVDDMIISTLSAHLRLIADIDTRNLILNLYNISTVGTDYPETTVNIFVRQLLIMLGFDTSIKLLDILINIPLDLTISKETVESIPDVTVGPLGENKIVLLVCEDKTIKNKSDNPQSQAIGEVIAAYQSFAMSKNDEIVKNYIERYTFPFVTAQGPFFVFYKVTNMSGEFLDDIKNGYKPEMPLKINRYAADTTNTQKPHGFNFARPKDRNKIIKMLMHFRDIVFSEVV